MSNPDSFINEVSEEVRRDQLYGYARRYGWIVALVIVAIVGGAAWIEFSKVQTQNAARANGAAFDAALQIEDGAERATALSELSDGDAALLARFAEAASLQQAGDVEGAAQRLDALMEEPGLYGELATLRRIGLPGAVLPAEERIALVEPIVDGDSAFSLLAREQLGLALVEQGLLDAAHSEFQFLIDAPLTTPALRDRAVQMIVATGGTLETGPVLVDTDPLEN